MKTILIGIIVFLVGSTAIIVANQNGGLFQGSFRGARSTVRQEVPLPALVSGGGISRNAQGKWQASGDECQLYDIEVTDPRTGQKRTVTFSTCPMRCCYTGEEMTKADDWAAESGVNNEQKTAVGAQLQRGNASANKLPASFGGQAQEGNGSLFVCDPNQAQKDSATQRWLGRAGFGQDAGDGGLGARNPRSYYSEGGSSETDQANAIARYTVARLKEQQAQDRMDRIKKDPNAKGAAADARKSSGDSSNFENTMKKKYGSDYQSKMSDREKEQQSYLKQVKNDANKVHEDNKKEFDKTIAERDEARENAREAVEDYHNAGGDEGELEEVKDSIKKEDAINCAADDDRCIDEKARKQLEAGLAAINEILVKKGIAPITSGQLNAFRTQKTPIDWKINPAPENDVGNVQGNRPLEPGLCQIADPTKAMPNPEEGATPQCNMGCTVDQMEVGHCGNEQQTQQGIQAKCGNQRGFIQQGAIDCPQDNPNCGPRPPRF